MNHPNKSELETKAIGKTRPASKPTDYIRYSQISTARQVLVRICQITNFGELREIEVRDREPYFGSTSAVLVDVRLDAEDAPRSELALGDFELRQELRRLLAKLDEIENGRISRIEIRAGLPRRVLFESAVQRMLP